MQFNELKFVVVEDKVEERKEVLRQLTSIGFEPENKIGVAATYEEAKALLEESAAEIHVVFLDLNIPRDAGDPRPEEKHGAALLDAVHFVLNQRPQVDIGVIVVSGQDLAANETAKKLLEEKYQGTLRGIVLKSELPRMLKANVKRLRKDPLAAGLRKVDSGLAEAFVYATDATNPIKERLKKARAVAIQLALNEIAYRDGSEDSHPELADDLNGIIRQLEARFSEDQSGRRRIKASKISTPGGWGTFLWRGALVQHLRTINAYRNTFEHLSEQPYEAGASSADEWEISPALLANVNTGNTVGKIVSLALSELVEWYLPWHSQVYAAPSNN
ncbi:MAG: hypothetical protein KDN20_18080 [Verrucomicrobiae bacterium]|nr:hypothetical protein [Verrucomicrobiae bacterium]